jgi:hypothetical protein
MSAGLWIWLAAALAYLAFRLWYDGWRGPLTPQETAHFMRLMEGTPGAEHTDMGTMRAFLEADDGKEFVMCNLVRLHQEPVAHPETGAPVSARSMLQTYVAQFVKVLFLHGGHPVVAARKVGGYVDAWACEPDPGWTVSGLMRYRSRRDMMRLATHPRFLAAYPFKLVATAQTFSFPTQVVVAFNLGPRVSVFLLLALAAALAHLARLVMIA